MLCDQHLLHQKCANSVFCHRFHDYVACHSGGQCWYYYTCMLWFCLTHWGQCKMGDIFICMFLSKDVRIFIQISLKFVPKCPINNTSALVQIMSCRRSGDKPLSEPMMVCHTHYNDVTMGAIASQITSLTVVYSTVYSDVDQRKHQSSASLAFVRGIHRGPVNSPHKWPVTFMRHWASMS